jgi:hypothetical protein
MLHNYVNDSVPIFRRNVSRSFHTSNDIKLKISRYVVFLRYTATKNVYSK